MGYCQSCSNPFQGHGNKCPICAELNGHTKPLELLEMLRCEHCKGTLFVVRLYTSHTLLECANCSEKVKLQRLMQC